MKLHHTGYAVKNIATAADTFAKLGFTAEGAEMIDESANVTILFMSNGPALIELVAPMSADSPVSGWLRKCGASPYHLCYQTDGIDRTIRELCNDGFVLVESCREAPALNGSPVAFLYNASVGLIELVEA